MKGFIIMDEKQTIFLGSDRCIGGAWNEWKAAGGRGEFLETRDHIYFIPPDAKDDDVVRNCGSIDYKDGKGYQPEFYPYTVKEARRRGKIIPLNEWKTFYY